MTIKKDNNPALFIYFLFVKMVIPKILIAMDKILVKKSFGKYSCNFIEAKVL